MVRIDHSNVMVANVAEVQELLLQAGAKQVWDCDVFGCPCQGFSVGKINIVLLDRSITKFLPYTPYHGEHGLWNIQINPEESTDALVKALDSRGVVRSEPQPTLDVPAGKPFIPDVSVFSWVKVNLPGAPGCHANYIEYLKPFAGMGKVFPDAELQFVEFRLGAEDVDAAVAYYKNVFGLEPSADNSFPLGDTTFRVVKGKAPVIVLRSSVASPDLKRTISGSDSGEGA